MIRAGILQTWHDVHDLCLFLLVIETLWSGWGGEGERGFEVGAKPFRKNKILHSDQFSLATGSAVGEKLKREKIGELSGSLAGLGKRVHVIFICPSTPFFPRSGAWSGLDCSQSPIFPWDRWDIVRLTVNDGHLDFQMYRGGGRRGL